MTLWKLLRRSPKIDTEDVHTFFERPELYDKDLVLTVYQRLVIQAIKQYMEGTDNTWAKNRALRLRPYLIQIGALDEQSDSPFGEMK